jgi:hypothetical protein
MAKKNKTKIHKVVDGQLLQMNKSFRELKQKQKDKIINWIYEEYKKYVSENGSVPGEQGDAQIMSAVLDKIEQAGIWIPSYEVEDYYVSRKARLKQRYENEKRLKYKDVYMIALRSGEELIGYYEKHEFRNSETMKMYDLW